MVTLDRNRTSTSLLPDIRSHIAPLHHRYWNETTDTLSSKGFQGSPIFNISDPYSFGGSGSCVTTGPFANYTLHLGPAKQVTDHCLTRRLGTVHTGATAEVVNGCLANDKFADMWPCVEAGQGPHGAGRKSMILAFSRELGLTCIYSQMVVYLAK